MRLHSHQYIYESLAGLYLKDHSDSTLCLTEEEAADKQLFQQVLKFTVFSDCICELELIHFHLPSPWKYKANPHEFITIPATKSRDIYIKQN